MVCTFIEEKLRGRGGIIERLEHIGCQVLTIVGWAALAQGIGIFVLFLDVWFETIQSKFSFLLLSYLLYAQGLHNSNIGQADPY